MPAIDLARLKKQSAQLADLFDRPDDFVRALHEMLDYYVNRSLRSVDSVATASVLKTYRTPPPIIKQIENDLGPLAAEDPTHALDLADRLWDEGWLELRLLAAFVLGQLPPQEQRLLPRLTAWAQQVRDPAVRLALLTTSLARLRDETPDQFILLVSEWLNPERQRLWPHGIQALLPLVRDPEFHNLPPVFDALGPVVESAPGLIQNELAEMLTALYAASPRETTFFLRQVLTQSNSPMTATTLRRISPSLPKGLVQETGDLFRIARTG